MPNQVEMFWVAEFSDGTAIAQFDPETGSEILFSSVDQTKLRKITWYPVTEELAAKTNEVAINPLLNPVSIVVPEGRKVRIFRRNTLDYSLATGKESRQEIQEYVLGLEGSSLLTRALRNGSVVISEEP